MNVTIGDSGRDRRGELRQEIGVRVVDDGVHRVESQAVEVVLLDPIQRVVNEEGAYDLAARVVEVDRVTPRRVMPRGEELRRVKMQIVAVGTEVVVDDVEQHHELTLVRALNEAFEIIGRAVAVLGRKRQHAVVAPIVFAARVGERHELDRGNTEITKIVQLPRGGREGSCLGERADVQLVDDGLVPRPAAPVAVGPRKRGRVDHLARCVHVLRIEARRRIGNPQRAAVEREAVAAALAGLLYDAHEKSVGV